jgi:hypothetical protein
MLMLRIKFLTIDPKSGLVIPLINLASLAESKRKASLLARNDNKWGIKLGFGMTSCTNAIGGFFVVWGGFI